MQKLTGYGHTYNFCNKQPRSAYSAEKIEQSNVTLLKHTQQIIEDMNCLKGSSMQENIHQSNNMLLEIKQHRSHSYLQHLLKRNRDTEPQRLYTAIVKQLRENIKRQLS